MVARICGCSHWHGNSGLTFCPQAEEPKDSDLLEKVLREWVRELQEPPRAARDDQCDGVVPCARNTDNLQCLQAGKGTEFFKIQTSPSD